MPHKHFQHSFFITLLAIGLVLSFMVFRPFIGVLLLAATFAIVFQPVYQQLLDWLGKKHTSLAALLTIVAVILIVLTPLTFFVSRLIAELGGFYGSFADSSLADGSLAWLRGFEDQVEALVPGLQVDLNFSRYAAELASWLLRNVGSIFTGVSSFLFSFFLWLLAFYYLLKDGDSFRKLAVKLSPLPDRYDREIIDKLQAAVNSVITGSIVIALLQGILTGVGFTIFGVPNATLWGSVAAVSALIPSIGTALVLVPGVAYLALAVGLTPALGLVVWGVVAVGLIDNFLGPRLIERGLPVHPFLILLSVIGGIGFFGLVGFLLGPLILSFLFALLEIYQKEFKSYIAQNT